MSSPIHFYLTFNPYLNDHEPGHTQAHEFCTFLENEIKKAKAEGKEAHAHWGKIIGKDRESKVDISKFQEVLEQNKENNHSTHIYITDFNNLWVGKVAEVSDKKSKDNRSLPFYEGKKVEIWFKLTDFALLAYTPEDTASKLSELYIQNKYHELEIDELSPFTTAIRYPAFVQDLSEEPYFDQLEEEYGHLIFQYNPGLANSSARKVLDSLHSYVFPENMYSKIPHSAKTEIEMAELDILEKRYHNICRNAFGYVKALEICLNDLVINHIKRKGYGNDFYVQPETMPPKLYLDDCKDGLVPISKWHKNYSITQLIYFVDRCVDKGHFCFKKAFSNHKPFVNFLTKEIPAALKENKILEIRGILAHNDSNSILEKDAHTIRNVILGIGCHGLIQKAYQSFYHEEFKSLTKIQGNYNKVDFKELKKKSA